MRFLIGASVSLADSVVPVSVAGLPSGRQVTIQATTRSSTGVTFSSQVTFRVPASGVVDLEDMAPLSGSYSGIAAMGLLWSMQPADHPLAYADLLPDGGQLVALSAIINGRTVATGQLTRLPAAAGVTVRNFRPKADGVYAELFRPPPYAGRRPAVLIFGGSEGGMSGAFTAGLLASHGYPTLALAYFGEPGLPQRLARIPLEYFATALRLLASQPGVDPHRLVIQGVSRGSEAALLVGADFPQLVHAVVALVPSNVVLDAGSDSGHLKQPAWTLNGTGISYQTQFGPAGGATIPVEKINGPIFMVCGGMDLIWPSCPMAQAIAARLQQTRRPPPILLAYPYAGHGVGTLVPNIAYDDAADLEGINPQANFPARADAWPRFLHFLATE